MRVLGPASDVWAQSGSSPRSRRSTVSRLRLAENGPFCSHLAPVALRAPSAAADASACFIISTLLLRALSRNQVSKKTLRRWTGQEFGGQRHRSLPWYFLLMTTRALSCTLSVVVPS